MLVWVGARPWLVAALACLGWVGVLQLQLAATRHQLATQLEAARVERGTAARTLHRQAGAVLDWNGEYNLFKHPLTIYGLNPINPKSVKGLQGEGSIITLH